MNSKLNEESKIEEEKFGENFSNSEFLSFIHEFLNVIFRVAIVNFKKKNSKYKLDETFQKLFDDYSKVNLEEFTNLIFELNSELNSIKDFLELNTKDIDFNSKDINLDILIICVNNCFLFCDNKINYDALFNNLYQNFQNLLIRKKIKKNNNVNTIISKFNKYINCYLNKINKTKGFKITEISPDQEENSQTKAFILKIKKLENEIQEFNIKYGEKQIEIKGLNKNNNELQKTQN